MMNDIRALQQMYGANFTTNGSDTVYTWNVLTGEFSVNGVVQGQLVALVPMPPPTTFS